MVEGAMRYFILIAFLLAALPASAQLGVVGTQGGYNGCSGTNKIDYGTTQSYGSTTTLQNSAATFGALTGTVAAGQTIFYKITICGSAVVVGSITSGNSDSAPVLSSPLALDRYRGAMTSARVCPGATGYTYLFKASVGGINRWLFCTPSGNPRWATGIQNSEGNVPKGSDAENGRAQTWGFDAWNAYTSTGGNVPFGVFGGLAPANLTQNYATILTPGNDAVNNPTAAFCNIGTGIANLRTGIPAGTIATPPNVADLYDTKLFTCTENELRYWDGTSSAGSEITTGVSGLYCISPANQGNWNVSGRCAAQYIDMHVGDDADYTNVFKSSGNAPVNNYPNLGFMVAVGAITSQAKSQWITFLTNKYGTVGALNTAWGTSSFYTAFGDAGGYGTGTGVIDEDGRHTTWMGNDPYMLNGTINHFGGACSCTAAAAAVQTDILAFEQQMVTYYAQQSVGAIRQLDPFHLITNPDSICNFGGCPNDQILTGLAAGFDLLYVNYDPGCTSSAPGNACPRGSGVVGTNYTYSSVDGNGVSGNNGGLKHAYDLTGKPLIVWYSVTAEGDSAASSTINYGTPDFGTQANRALQYKTDVPLFLNARATNGDHYIAGLEWWGWVDNDSPQQNWGLTTTNAHNAYDGHEDVTASVSCSAPNQLLTCGSEASYNGAGNLLLGTNGATTTNANIYPTIFTAQGGGGGTTTAPAPVMLVRK